MATLDVLNLFWHLRCILNRQNVKQAYAEPKEGIHSDGGVLSEAGFGWEQEFRHIKGVYLTLCS